MGRLCSLPNVEARVPRRLCLPRASTSAGQPRGCPGQCDSAMSPPSARRRRRTNATRTFWNRQERKPTPHTTGPRARQGRRRRAHSSHRESKAARDTLLGSRNATGCRESSALCRLPKTTMIASLSAGRCTPAAALPSASRPLAAPACARRDAAASPAERQGCHPAAPALPATDDSLPPSAVRAARRAAGLQKLWAPLRARATFADGSGPRRKAKEGPRVPTAATTTEAARAGRRRPAGHAAAAHAAARGHAAARKAARAAAPAAAQTRRRRRDPRNLRRRRDVGGGAAPRCYHRRRSLEFCARARRRRRRRGAW